MKLYNVTENYILYLKMFDDKVTNNKDKKSNRPFVGIVFQLDNISYYAPLTSPKAKHKTMHNNFDFLKIKGGECGAINFNNMIPIPDKELLPVELSISYTDSDDEVKYKNLLAKQLDWCNKNEEQIKSKAEFLHNNINNKNFEKIKVRCCNFSLLEEKALEYEKMLINKKEFPSIEDITGLDDEPSPRQNLNKSAEQELGK